MPEETLKRFLERYPRLFVLTGAGCSTESGIPDYRDEEGAWKNAQPIQFRDFMTDPLRRARYWARSLIGWRHFGAARPNAAHASLAELERQGRIELLVTQNVDGLHQVAGSHRVVDLHGRLDAVRCMQCGDVRRRSALQPMLEALNPEWRHREAVTAPDGDALLVDVDFAGFKVPSCECCGGILKPDVVFFGENVPQDRVQAAYAGLGRADAMLVVGSSLMVYSGYRYARAAAERGLPIAAVNRGRTRADALLSFKVSRPCGETLSELASALACHLP